MADKPWEQQPDETSKAYVAFCGYRNLGPERTLIKAYEIYRELDTGSRGSREAPKYFKGWSVEYGWVERARFFDAHLEDLKTEAMETEAAKVGKLWASRFENLREQEFAAAQTLIERAQEMLEYPITRTEEKDEEGGRTVIIMPARWSPFDAANFLNQASKLGRLAIGTVTDSQRVEVEQQEMVVGGRKVKF